MYFKTTGSTNSGTGLQVYKVSMSAGDGVGGVGVVAGGKGELSHYTVRIKETHGDDWPL